MHNTLYLYFQQNTATAQPIIKVIVEKGVEGLNEWLHDWKNAQQKIQLLIGVKRLNELSLDHLI